MAEREVRRCRAALRCGPRDRFPRRRLHLRPPLGSRRRLLRRAARSLAARRARAAGSSPLFLPRPRAIARRAGRARAPAASSRATSAISLLRIALRLAARHRGRPRRRRRHRAVLAGARGRHCPLVSALFPIPKIALLPLFILWFGIGEASKVATIALGVFFPTAIATYCGGRQRAAQPDPHGAELQRAARPASCWKVVLPGALPAILAGFRISAVDRADPAGLGRDDRRQVGIGAFIADGRQPDADRPSDGRHRGDRRCSASSSAR